MCCNTVLESWQKTRPEELRRGGIPKLMRAGIAKKFAVGNLMLGGML
jgi:hypothetical protein